MVKEKIEAFSKNLEANGIMNPEDSFLPNLGVKPLYLTQLTQPITKYNAADFEVPKELVYWEESSNNEPFSVDQLIKYQRPLVDELRSSGVMGMIEEALEQKIDWKFYLEDRFNQSEDGISNTFDFLTHTLENAEQGEWFLSFAGPVVKRDKSLDPNLHLLFTKFSEDEDLGISDLLRVSYGWDKSLVVAGSAVFYCGVIPEEEVEREEIIGDVIALAVISPKPDFLSDSFSLLHNHDIDLPFNSYWDKQEGSLVYAKLLHEYYEGKKAKILSLATQ